MSMPRSRVPELPDLVEDPDRRILLNNLTWEQYEDLLTTLGDSSGVRVAYLEGAVELMSPSRTHERRKKTTGRLLEAWAEARDLDLNGFGSTTFRKAAKERGVEPDECYVLGEELGDVPDLAIEIVHTNPLLDKLSIYAGLGVPEVWLFRREAFEVYVLAQGTYERRDKSALLPDVDLRRLASLIDEPSQKAAVRRFLGR
jgi:Uma2 family endonuclease